MIIMREESNQADPTQKIVSHSSLAQGQLIWKISVTFVRDMIGRKEEV